MHGACVTNDKLTLSPGASEQGEQGQRLLPQLWGAGAVLPQKFVNVTVTG